MNNLIIDTASNSFITFNQLLDRLDILYTALTPGLLAVARQSLKRYNDRAENPVYVVEGVQYAAGDDIPVEYLTIARVLEVEPHPSTGYSASIKVVGVLNRQLWASEWKKVRQQREHLLSKADWVESSTVVTEGCKKAFKAYKQLLRDLPSLYQYPNEVAYPDTPPILYKTLPKQSSEKLSEAEVLEYKASNNMNFISNWKKFNFTDDRKIVELLYKAYA